MNKLIERIESGEPVAGVRMYYNLGNDYHVEGRGAYASVKVLGLVCKSGDIRVRVAPVAGRGDFIVKPENLIDETKEAALKIENEAKAEELERAITHHTYVRDKRTHLEKAYSALPPAKQKKVNDELEQRKIKSLSEVHTNSIDHFASIIARLTFGVGK